jgi:hypothetical protein
MKTHADNVEGKAEDVPEQQGDARQEMAEPVAVVGGVEGGYEEWGWDWGHRGRGSEVEDVEDGKGVEDEDVCESCGLEDARVGWRGWVAQVEVEVWRWRVDW